MVDVAEPSEPEPAAGPSPLQHGVFVALCWLGVLPVYWSEYGWPGEVLEPVQHGGWITLDLTGIFTLIYQFFAGSYTLLTTLIFLHARKRGRRMSWAEYILYGPVAFGLLVLVWYAALALG
jgi:hypothetical protein